MTVDDQLIEKIKKRDSNAFRVFVEHYQRRLYVLCFDLTGNHHDAEDLSQEVFIKVFRASHQLREHRDVQSWLYRIAINTFIDKRRKRMNTLLKFWLDSDDQTIEAIDNQSSNQPDHFVEIKSTQAQIHKALKKLSARERAVFVLRHYHEHSLYEIAQILSIAEGTVKSLLFRAVRKLRPMLASYAGQTMEDAR